MEKEEILRRAQNGRKNQMDEMQEQVEKSASRFAVIVGGIVCIILMVFKMWEGEPWYDVYAIWLFMVGGMHLYKWKKLCEKSEGWLGIAWLGAGIFIAISYIVDILK